MTTGSKKIPQLINQQRWIAATAHISSIIRGATLVHLQEASRHATPQLPIAEEHGTPGDSLGISRKMMGYDWKAPFGNP